MSSLLHTGGVSGDDSSTKPLSLHLSFFLSLSFSFTSSTSPSLHSFNLSVIGRGSNRERECKRHAERGEERKNSRDEEREEGLHESLHTHNGEMKLRGLRRRHVSSTPPDYLYVSDICVIPYSVLCHQIGHRILGADEEMARSASLS